MSPRRASLPPPLPPLRARPDSPLRFRSGRDRPACSLPPPAPGGGINTISKPSKPSTPAPPSSLPPPLPPLRVCPDTSPRFRSGRARSDARCPLPLPAGHKYNKQTIKTFNTSATIVPTPAPSPASRLPGHVPSHSLGSCPVRRSLPPPAPGGGF